MTIVNSKDKGDRAERALVDFLDHEGFAARRIIAGAHDDIGDIDIHPDIVLEVKNRYKVSLGEYLTALWAQKGNKDAAFGFIAIKMRGKANPLEWGYMIDGPTFVNILRLLVRPGDLKVQE